MGETHLRSIFPQSGCMAAALSQDVLQWADTRNKKSSITLLLPTNAE